MGKNLLKKPVKLETQSFIRKFQKKENPSIRLAFYPNPASLLTWRRIHTPDEFNVIYGKEYGFLECALSSCTNLYLKPGKEKTADIFKAITDGFYLTEAFGLHAGMKNVTGDFSNPVTGFKIENGQTTFRIRGATIGGNLFELLKSVDKAGDDLT